jgi:glycosyltransferase involved in cell wall biosynthesis
MKILVISDAESLDGAQGMLRFVTRHWKNNLGWDIDVFQPRGEKGNQEILLQAGINPVSEISQITNYNVVLVNTYSNIDQLAKIADIPIVFWVHEARVVLWSIHIPVSTTMRLFLRPQRIIFQTQYQANVVFKSFLFDLPSERIVIIPNGLEPLQINIAPRSNDGKLKISWLGSLIARKRPIDLVNAAIGLANEFPLAVNFIGSTADAHSIGPEFEQFIKAPPNLITFSGALLQPEALRAVAESDIFCHTSEDESFPLAPLEAASLGIPVILTNLPTYQFVGWKHGENCLLYPVGDVASLAQCIRVLRNNAGLRAQLVARARALAELHNSNLFLERMTQVMRPWIPPAP